MHSIFAIEPEALNNWKDIRYVVEKFGFHRGALIGKYPNKKWLKSVYQACEANGVRDVEFSRITERLNQAKNDRMFALGLPYDPEKGWLDNTLSEEIVKQFRYVLTSHTHHDERVCAIEEIPEDLFNNLREVKVRRVASVLADAAHYLLFNTKKLILVDPFFQPKPKNIKVLAEFISKAKQGKARLSEIEIHSSLKKYPVNIGILSDEYRAALENLHTGISFKIVRWNKNFASGDVDLHARYLIADNGGLRFDRGFEEPNDHDQRNTLTDIICMEPGIVEEIRSNYTIDESNTQIADVLSLP